MILATCDLIRSFVPGLVAVGLLMSQGAARASVQTVPTSLKPGDQYRLVFVTSTGRDPNSANIDSYNTFVSTIASAVPALSALGIEWKAIGSTVSVNARQNTNTDPTPAGVTGVPIFLLNDTLFATDYDDLWDGSPVGQNLNITESGSPLTQVNQTTDRGWVWTGSDNSGFAYFGSFSGPLGAASPNVAYGNSKPNGGVDSPGGADGWLFDLQAHNNHVLSLYAMSGILTVPGDPNVAPEAASLITWGGILLGAGLTAYRRHAPRLLVH